MLDQSKLVADDKEFSKVNSLTHEEVTGIVTKIMNLQNEFDLSKMGVKKMNDCWWLLHDSTVLKSTGAYSADYYGQQYDEDGVEIIAILVLDNNDYPKDFEIMRLDGGKVISNLSNMKFNYIKSKLSNT